MTLLIIIFAALILLTGIIIVINPEVIFGFLKNNVDNLVLHILAVGVRLIVGVLLIYQSSVSKFPIVIDVIGFLALVAALILAVMGRHNFNRLMLWALSLSKPFARVGGVFAVAFGAFIIFSFI